MLLMTNNPLSIYSHKRSVVIPGAAARDPRRTPSLSKPADKSTQKRCEITVERSEQGKMCAAPCISDLPERRWLIPRHLLKWRRFINNEGSHIGWPGEEKWWEMYQNQGSTAATAIDANVTAFFPHHSSSFKECLSTRILIIYIPYETSRERERAIYIKVKICFLVIPESLR